MSDYKCPTDYEHIVDDSNWVEKASTGMKLFHTNNIACYQSSSLPPSTIMCRTEDGENIGPWNLCLKQDNSSPGYSVPWTEVAVPIAFFACLAGLLWVLVKWKRGNKTQPSFHHEEVYRGCEISNSDVEMQTAVPDVQDFGRVLHGVMESLICTRPTVLNI